MRRRSLGAALLAVATVGPSTAQTQPWPQRPVRLLVPYIPGSGPDTAARQFVEPLTAALGQPVVVENRPGAGGTIGTEAAARAAPDGHTLLLGTNAMLVNAHLHRRPLGYDPLRDFAPVALLVTMPHALVVPAAAGAPASVAALVAALREAGGRAAYASGGNGSGAHLAAEMFKAQAGVRAEHVPFRGAPDIVNAVMAGQVAFGVPTLATATELVRTGRLRALAVTSPERNHALPAVPTFAEAGLPGVRLVSWFGLLAPTGTPPGPVARVEGAVRATLADPAFRARLTADGSVASGTGAAAFAGFLREDDARWAEAVRLSGARVD